MCIRDRTTIYKGYRGRLILSQILLIVAALCTCLLYTSLVPAGILFYLLQPEVRKAFGR